jgi:tripartite-type tricarboxylate transporter receptor subunit TctC
MKRFLMIFTVFIFAVFSTCTLSSHAQQSGLIKIVYTFGPGGSGDAATRLIAEHMRASLGVPVIVENKVGAGGRVAIEFVKSSPADGNTLLMTSMGPMAILPYTMGNLNYNPHKDFQPVAHVVDSSIALAVATSAAPTSSIKTLDEYVSWVRKTASPSMFAVAPLGGLPHFLGLQFANVNKLQMEALGYKGGAQTITALMGGEVPAAIMTPSELIPMHKAGKLRILSVSSKTRMPLLPDVPTFKEAGSNIEASTWFGIFAPAGTPSEKVSRLSNAIANAVKDPVINKRLIEMGFEPTGYGPKDLARILREDDDRWRPVIQASGYKIVP